MQCCANARHESDSVMPLRPIAAVSEGAPQCPSIVPERVEIHFSQADGKSGSPVDAWTQLLEARLVLLENQLMAKIREVSMKMFDRANHMLEVRQEMHEVRQEMHEFRRACSQQFGAAIMQAPGADAYGKELDELTQRVEGLLPQISSCVNGHKELRQELYIMRCKSEFSREALLTGAPEATREAETEKQEHGQCEEASRPRAVPLDLPSVKNSSEANEDNVLEKLAKQELDLAQMRTKQEIYLAQVRELVESAGKERVGGESNHNDDDEKHANTMEVTEGGIPQRLSKSHGLSNAEAIQLALKSATHPVAENVWESAILVNLSAVGAGSSVFLVMGILLNILLQLTFVFVVAHSFSSSHLPEEGDVWAWRELQGHQAANMQMASGASLVRAICDDDQTLITSNKQHNLYNLITDYTDRGQLGISLGFMLCTMTIIQWVLIVMQECRKILSYISAVLNLPVYGWHTKLDISEEGIIISSCSILRRAIVLLLSAVRLGVAACLLIAGCIWLAHTICITDLVLNAAALAAVMDVDEVVFASLAPMPVKTIVRGIKPLNRPTRFHWHGMAAAPATLLVSITVVVLIITQYVIPNIERMNQIQEALCGGFKDFVISSSQFTVILATGTSLSGQSETKSFPRQAVLNMINNVESIEGTAEISEVIYVANPGDFHSIRVADFQSTVAFLTTQILGTECEDYDFAAVDAVPSFKHIMSFFFQAESCAEVINHCSGDWRIVRMLCPQTCGCNQLHSGLFKNGVNQGCPKDACLSTQVYMMQRSSVPCMDYNMSDLMQMTGWTNFVSQWVGYWKVAQPRLADDIEQGGLALMTYGCGVFKYLPLRIARMLCRPTTEFSSLNAYCPVTCGCMNKFEVDCPDQCS